ncbi:ATP-binding cassette domain-containing protein [Acidobacteriota bacterium]
MVDHSENLALDIQDLSLKFNKRQIFNGFSMTLRKGEITAIWGSSGSGKSTLLKCILGFVSPESGSIHIWDQELNSRTVWPLRLHLGYVQQEPDPGVGNVSDFLKIPLSFKANRQKSGNFDQLEEMMSAFRLDTSLLDEKMTTLSGGEKQRFSLISALLLDRDIYLLDEITSALDENTVEDVLEYLKNRKGISILAATHDRRVRDYCDTVFQFDTRHDGDSG